MSLSNNKLPQTKNETKPKSKSIDNQIIINDPTIIAYYNNNPDIDIVTMNHIFIDILKNLSNNLSTTINSTIMSNILSVVKEIKGDMTNMNSNIIIKILETKKEYINDIKTLLDNNTLINQDKFSNLLEKSIDTITNKTNIIINEMIPKSQVGFIDMNNNIKIHFTTIMDKLLQEIKNEKSKEEIITDIDNHIKKMFTSINDTIFKVVQTSEERTTNNVQHIKEIINSKYNLQETLTNNLNDFLNKYKSNSSIKGNISEVALYDVLTSLLPLDKVERCNKETSSCDIIVTRKDNFKPTILFENKDYENQVDTNEVSKFENDLKVKRHHGIFISQNSHIVFKDNYHIDIKNGLIHLYISNVNYNPDKIKVAIDIIDNLSSRIEYSNNDNNDDCFNIKNDDLENIREEYKRFAIKKNNMCELIKNTSKQLQDTLEDIQLPIIQKILIGDTDNKKFKCDFCNTTDFKQNPSGLASHKRNCKLNPKSKNIVIETTKNVSNIN